MYHAPPSACLYTRLFCVSNSERRLAHVERSINEYHVGGSNETLIVNGINEKEGRGVYDDLLIGVKSACSEV